MSLHHLHPQHGQECPKCGTHWSGNVNSGCPLCAGTGKIGGDAEPCINVYTNANGSFGWRHTQPRSPVDFEASGLTDFDTVEDALFAARCALSSVRISRVNNGPDSERFVAQFGRGQCVFGPTRDAALAAGLEAK
ncbi:MAG: hypothetical protein ACQGVC_18085 [Myxococcota bacterium]